MRNGCAIGSLRENVGAYLESVNRYGSGSYYHSKRDVPRNCV